MNKTHAFTRALAVFEGGGVRGAAFSGAYSEAAKSGVTFIGAVGASAGSIAAAFVAASVTPERMVELLDEDFSTFLIPGDSRIPGDPMWVNYLAKFIPGSTGKRIRGLLNLGEYSSRRIGEWVNETLASELGMRGRDVQFRDLPKPLAVVAADVTSSRAKIWSSRRTPTASVGHAVRASCSIPFFFQPVIDEANTLVDGGLIANLPLFLARGVLPENETPVLCFRLVSSGSDKPRVASNSFDYGLSLIDVALAGTTEVQLSFSTKRQVIDINTGTIRATDFDITLLKDTGFAPKERKLFPNSL